MAEWFKAHAWNACVRESVPWVRIPLSPPARPIGIFSGARSVAASVQETGGFAARHPHLARCAADPNCDQFILSRAFFSDESALGPGWYGCAKCGQSGSILSWDARWFATASPKRFDPWEMIDRRLVGCGALGSHGAVLSRRPGLHGSVCAPPETNGPSINPSCSGHAGQPTRGFARAGRR